MQRDRESSSRELARLSVSRITLMNLSNAYMLTSIDLRIQNLNNTCMLTSIDSGVPTGSPPTHNADDIRQSLPFACCDTCRVGLLTVQSRTSTFSSSERSTSVFEHSNDCTDSLTHSSSKSGTSRSRRVCSAASGADFRCHTSPARSGLGCGGSSACWHTCRARREHDLRSRLSKSLISQ